MKAESGIRDASIASKVGRPVSGIRGVYGWLRGLLEVLAVGGFQRLRGRLGAAVPTFLLMITSVWAEPVAYFASTRGDISPFIGTPATLLDTTFAVSEIIETPVSVSPDGHLCIVLGNGVTLCLRAGEDAQGELIIHEFEQQPYEPDERIWKVEPSRTKLVVELKSGQLLVSAPTLRDDSDVFLQCGEATFRILGGDYFLVPFDEAGAAQLQIVSGEVKVRFEYEGAQPYDQSYNHVAGEVITHLGREAHASKLAEAELAAVRDLLAPVTLMRKRVLFDKREDSSVIGVRVVEREFIDGVPVNIDYIEHPNKRKR